MKKLLAALLVFGLMAPGAHAAFVIEDIQVDGLQRISAGTVFNYLPVSVGSTVTEADYPDIIRALFRTGFFTDVSLERSGNVLIVTVTERPAIAEVEITGNRDIATDDLREALESVGLSEGRVFDRSLLDQMEQELLQQYFARGKYAVEIDTEAQSLPRNRVAITLAISEGVTARIRQINIVGNEAFKDSNLLDEFQLSTTGFLSFLTKDDRYSKQQLAADIETLRSFYLDRGYLKFAVDSTQVFITPDKKDIYITINITEGERYTIEDIGLAGDLIVPEEELRPLITVQPGAIFSRADITESQEKISDRLGDDGYAFANINAVPELNEAEKTVALTFVIDPGRRVYVRRINFQGNVKTHDEVLRREMRQLEGAWFSNSSVKRSRTRLERLPYLEEVNVETPPVAGETDQVDVNFTVLERPSGNLLVGFGWGQEGGLLFNASLNQENFLGTGQKVNFAFSNSQINTNYILSYENPYFTQDGISLGVRLFFRKQDAGEANVADYTVDDFGGRLNFGIPLNEFDTLNTAVGYENIKIDDTRETPIEILNFLDEEGDQFNNVKLRLGWERDRRNRIIFADRGSLNALSAEVTVPGSDLTFYRLNYRHLSYFSIYRPLTLSLRGDAGYGDGYGDTQQLPFFENYFAGGLNSVRGYKTNTLGPRFSDDEPSGGSVKLVGSTSLIFPVPFLKDVRNFRLAAFADGGNVFSSTSDVKLDDLRFSAGLSVQWLSPLGPLVLSAAAPLNKKSGDDTQPFQFSFGVPF